MTVDDLYLSTELYYQMHGHTAGQEVKGGITPALYDFLSYIDEKIAAIERDLEANGRDIRSGVGPIIDNLIDWYGVIAKELRNRGEVV